MIWLKRLSPFIVIALLWGGYTAYRHYSEQKLERLEQRMATVTAHVWIGSALYRDDPERFLAYRDSVLTANGTSIEELDRYTLRYGDAPEKYDRFASMVANLVDSLYKVEDSLAKVPEGGVDSVKAE